MISRFYEQFALPKSCYLNKRVYKKLLEENANLGATDRKTLKEDVGVIYWQYTLKPSTIQIQPYRDEQREYLEVAVIEVSLKSEKHTDRLAELFQRAIPYPTLLVFTHNDRILLNGAHKRLNLAEKDKVVIESLHSTYWIDLANPISSEKEFLESFSVANFSYMNFYRFYQDMLARIIALNCASHSGRYGLSDAGFSTTETRVQLLQEIQSLQLEKIGLQRKLSKEKNMGTQVQLNTRVRQIRDRVDTIKNSL